MCRPRTRPSSPHRVRLGQSSAAPPAARQVEVVHDGQPVRERPSSMTKAGSGSGARARLEAARSRDGRAIGCVCGGKGGRRCACSGHVQLTQIERQAPSVREEEPFSCSSSELPSTTARRPWPLALSCLLCPCFSLLVCCFPELPQTVARRPLRRSCRYVCEP